MLRTLAFLLMLALTGPAVAQPLPNTIRSAALTAAQQQDLENRLGRLGARFQSLAAQTNLREAALRNVAVEIFGASPNLDYDAYVSLIDNGARELRGYIDSARARNESDPTTADLRARAISAAEAGRLAEARGLYDQLITHTEGTLEAQWAREDRERQAQRNAQTLAVAADIAESARLAYAAADFQDAARRYAQAAQRAPEGSRERWQYLLSQTNTLIDSAFRFARHADIVQAATILETSVIPLTQRDAQPNDWATAQFRLGTAYRMLGETGDVSALRRAVTAYQAASTVWTEARPEDWGPVQTSLGGVYIRLAETGILSAWEPAIVAIENGIRATNRERNTSSWGLANIYLMTAISGALRSQPRSTSDAIALVERGYHAADDALSVFSRQAEPLEWSSALSARADIRMDHADITHDAALVREGIAEVNESLSVLSRERTPRLWSDRHSKLGAAYLRLVRIGDDSAVAGAVAAYEEVARTRTRDAGPLPWGIAQMNLAVAYLEAARRGQTNYRQPALEAANNALNAFQEAGHMAYAQRAAFVIAELSPPP